MKLKTIILLFTVLTLSGCSLWPFGTSSQETSNPPTPTLTQEEVKGVKEELEEKTAINLPTDAQQSVLRDVTGGNASGFATRKFANNKFDHTILADLPDPAMGEFYEGWLVRGQTGQENFDVLYTGKLKSNKGGWLLEFSSQQDLTDHPGVVVTLEKLDDKKPEKHILEGNF